MRINTIVIFKTMHLNAVFECLTLAIRELHYDEAELTVLWFANQANGSLLASSILTGCYTSGLELN